MKSVLITGGYPKYKKIERLDENIEIRRVEVSNLSKYNFWVTLNYKLWKELKANENIDLLHLHNYWGVWVSLLRKQLKIPIVFTMHGDDVEWYHNVEYFPFFLDPVQNLKDRFLTKESVFFQKIMCEHVDHAVGVSRAMVKWIVKNWDVKRSNISYIPNGIDTKVFYPRRTAPLKRKYNVDFVILYVGAFSMRKGLRYLFSALKTLKEKYCFKLLIIGDDKEIYKEYTRRLIQQFGISDVVKFLGKIPNLELPKYYSGADVFVLPSLSEGLPKVVLEALSCECPVIATDTSGTSEVIINEKTGLLVQKKNPHALARSIEFMINNKNAAKKMAKKGRELVKKKFTWKIVAESYKKLYEKLVK